MSARRISYAVVHEGVGELRREPRHAAEQVSQVILGSVLETLSVRAGGEWLRVRSDDGYKGWIRGWSVTPMTASALDAYRAGPFVEVDSMVARVRSRPSGRSAPLREATLGARLRRLGRSGRWIRVLLPDGAVGYLGANDLLVDRTSLRGRLRPRDIPALLRTAQRFLGVPYQWGGVTPKGADCSGFVQTAFRLHGVVLPRDSGDQFRLVRRTSFLERDVDETQIGHLLFFGAEDARISHVGIGLGDGRMIHARGRVRIDSLRPGATGADPHLRSSFRGSGPVLF